MKTPPLILLVLSIILMFVPARCTSKTEHAILALTKPFVYLYAQSSPAETMTPKNEQSLKPKDRMHLLEQRIADLNNEVLLLKNENLSLANKLKSVSDFRETSPSGTNIKEYYNIVLADVIIKSDISIWRKSLLIDRGSRDGIRAGLTVVSGKYLVGRISEIGPFTSRVQLITDPVFRAQVILVPPIDGQKEESPSAPVEGGKGKEPASSKSAQTANTGRKTSGKSSPENPATGFGVMSGLSFNNASVKWVFRELKVARGWDVFSAPDPYAVIPRGLIVGKVDDVSTDGFFNILTVTPAIDFQNLSYVMILIPNPERIRDAGK